MRRSSQRLLIVFAAGILLAPALVHAADDVSVVLTARKVTVTDGKEAMAPADQARPGDVIEYRAAYRNTSTHPVRQLAATLPVPKGMEFLALSAAPQALMASLDGRQFEPVPLKRRVKLASGREVLREVPPSEYRWLRWSLGTIGPREARTVSARMRVTPLQVAADVR